MWSTSNLDIAGLLLVSLVLGLSACGEVDADIDTSELESDPTEVPAYEEQKANGLIQGQPWTVASARVRKPGAPDVGAGEHLIVELYGQSHGDLCSGLTPRKSRPAFREGLVELRDVPAEIGTSRLVTSMEHSDPGDGRPELSFMRRKGQQSWGGVPYAKGWVEIVEITDDRVRGRFSAISQVDGDDRATGWFVAERCGCVNCR